MARFRRIGIVLVNGVLLVALAGLLGAYLVAVHDLPAQLYTVDQRAFLAYNRARSVAQFAPTWEAVAADGAVMAAAMPIQDSRVRATLDARYEAQGGVSATVYDLDFYGTYRLGHTGAVSATVAVFFPFPGNLETLHEVRFTVDGVEPRDAGYSAQGIRWQTVLGPEEVREIEVSYRADGAHRFSYGLQHDQRTDVDVVVTLRGLSGGEVPEPSLPPSAQETEEGGEVWRWQYAGLIADRDIALTLPERLSFAQRVARLSGDFRVLARWAPLLVGAYLASLAGALYLGGVRLRLANYLLAGCGMALFYPLLTFLGGLVGLVPAAALALALVSALLVAFVGLTAGWRRAALRAALLTLVFLGCFSLGTLTPWSGLFVTGGALLLVGVYMLFYARRTPPVPETPPGQAPDARKLHAVDTLDGAAQGRKAGEGTPQPSVDAIDEPDDGALDTEDAAVHVPSPSEEAAGQADEADQADEAHCPYCARPLEDSYRYCPGCGQDTSHLRRCAACGRRQFVPEGAAAIHCLRCGASIEGRAGGADTPGDIDGKEHTL